MKPWYSPEDIDKGGRWLSDLSTQLEKQSVAIICLTPENISAPWLLFEAGALSKALDASWVCPVLFDLEPTDYQGPLAQFQATRATKEDIRRLLGNINKRQDVPLVESQLDTLYNLLWPQLEAQFTAISKMEKSPNLPHRQAPELLSEVLTRVRSIERQMLSNRLRAEPIRRRIAPTGVEPGDTDEFVFRLEKATTEMSLVQRQMQSIAEEINALPQDVEEEARAKLIDRHATVARIYERLAADVDRMKRIFESVSHAQATVWGAKAGSPKEEG